jgi:hypothetical protein
VSDEADVFPLDHDIVVCPQLVGDRVQTRRRLLAGGLSSPSAPSVASKLQSSRMSRAIRRCSPDDRSRTSPGSDDARPGMLHDP